MDKSRADFEAWAVTEEADLDLTVIRNEKLDIEGYRSSVTWAAWKAWRASRNQALESALAACNKQTIEAVAPLSSRFLYRSAIADCIDAIRSLEGNATSSDEMPEGEKKQLFATCREIFPATLGNATKEMFRKISDPANAHLFTVEAALAAFSDIEGDGLGQKAEGEAK